MQIQNYDIPKATVEKHIVILHNFQVSCFAFNVKFKPSNFNLESFEVGLNNIEEVVNLLMLFDKTSICFGCPKAIYFSSKCFCNLLYSLDNFTKIITNYYLIYYLNYFIFR